jgi:hypothetical protein
MSAISHGAKFDLGDQHILVLLRDTHSVSIVSPRETPHPVRLEVLAPDGSLRGSRDYSSLDDLLEGRWVESDEVL